MERFFRETQCLVASDSPLGGLRFGGPPGGLSRGQSRFLPTHVLWERRVCFVLAVEMHYFAAVSLTLLCTPSAIFHLCRGLSGSRGAWPEDLALKS